MSHSSKVIKSQVGLVGPSNLLPVGQKHRTQAGLVTGVWSMGVARKQFHGMEPFPCGMHLRSTVSELS